MSMLLNLVDNDGLLRIAVVTPVVAVLSLLAWAYLRRSRSRLPFPPGPKPLPLLGNTFDFPIHNGWLTYARWSKQYGPSCPARMSHWCARPL